MMNTKSIYLRSEINNTEKRTALIPSDANKLIKDGWACYVEKSQNRIYPDKLYLEELCELTDLPWYHEKFSSSLIIGLKQFDNVHLLNEHTHIYFSHSYQNQAGSIQLLKQFSDSNSTLLDLEYFLEPNGSRLVSFGFWAGIVGCGLALLEYLNTKLSLQSLQNLTWWDNYSLFIDLIQNKLKLLNSPVDIKIGLIGANGNCGRGVQKLLNELELNYTILNSNSDPNTFVSFDIFINCIKLNPNSTQIWFDDSTNFTNPIIISDISCDYTKPNNPIKLYNKNTTWNNPIFKPNQFVKIIAIDNLPSMIPQSSSDYFSNQFVQLLKDYSNDNNKIWEQNLNIYKNKIS
jgi:saccharopine dehydrogenase (NAD+, L-lysine-forming)